MKQYTSLIQTAWRITRRTPVLWWFGLFALVLGGRGIEIESVFSNSGLLTSNVNPLRPEFWQVDQWGARVNQAVQTEPSLLGIIPILALLAVIIGVMMIVAQIGLVDAFAKNAKRRLLPRYSLDEAFSASRDHFWKVIGINVFGKGLSLALLVGATGPLITTTLTNMRITASLLLYGCAAAAIVIISAWVKFAINAVVLDNQHVAGALTTAWQMIKRNFGAVIELAILMFALYIGVNAIAFVAASVVALPLAFFGFIVYLGSGLLFGVQLFVLLAYILYVIFLIFAMMLFSTMHYGSWTLLYLQVKKQPLIAKVRRLFH